jgi:Crinkler effector protein N-terminal domain
MVKLFCALVGEKGSAFSIKIDANESVDDLKVAIKQKQMYEFASSKLQLFLGKKSDDTWLDSNTADAVTLNGDGYPGSFTHMHPSLWINNPNNFGDKFQPREGDIHVLVVVPKQETSTLILPSVLQKIQTILTLFCAVVGEKGSTFSIKIDASEYVDDLKDAIKQKQMYDFASSKLRLFLGKQGDNKWLNFSAVDTVTTDAKGNPEGFTLMDFFLLIKNPWYFGERFEFKEGDIHVLVVVPENMGKIPSRVEFLAQSESNRSVDTISSCPLSTKMSFMQKLGLRYKLVPTNEMMEDSIPGYKWSELNEKHPEQRKNYFEYFENHLKDAMKVGQQKKDILVDVSQMKNLLSCNDKSSLPFELKGTTDPIIVQNVGYHIKDFAGHTRKRSCSDAFWLSSQWIAGHERSLRSKK